jgi:hypothetical protein
MECHFNGFSMKIETFRWGQDFFGPFNGTSDSEGHFKAKKSLCFSSLQSPVHRCTGT